MKPSVEYSAFVVNRNVQAMQEVPIPENPTELKSFLGLASYYHRFIPDMATTTAHPLNRLFVENNPWKMVLTMLYQYYTYFYCCTYLHLIKLLSLKSLLWESQ